MENIKKIKLNKILKAISKIKEQINYYQCELEANEDLTDKKFNSYANQIKELARIIDSFEGHVDELRSFNIDKINNILN